MGHQSLHTRRSRVREEKPVRTHETSPAKMISQSSNKNKQVPRTKRTDSSLSTAQKNARSARARGTTLRARRKARTTHVKCEEKIQSEYKQKIGNNTRAKRTKRSLSSARNGAHRARARSSTLRGEGGEVESAQNTSKVTSEK